MVRVKISILDLLSNHAKAPAAPKNTFPRFDDSDVETRLSKRDDDVYVLHKLRLGLALTLLQNQS